MVTHSTQPIFIPPCKAEDFLWVWGIICTKELNQTPSAILDIDEDILTDEYIKLALQQDYRLIEYIKKNRRTNEIIKFASQYNINIKNFYDSE